MNDQRRGLGYRPDIADPRDQRHSLTRKLHHLREDWVTPLPESASIIRFLPRGAELDQGPLGSCVANAISYAFVILTKMHGGPDLPLSRLFAYWHSRNQHGDAASDTGTYLRSCIKVLNKLGRPPETVWPYDISRFATKPPPTALMAAHDRRVATYERIATTGAGRANEFRVALASHKPVVFGTQVSSAFVSYHETKDRMRVWPVPLHSELVGGHAMCAVGYDPDGVTIVQSWGKGWGEHGFGKLSWDYLTSYLTVDCWALSL